MIKILFLLFSIITLSFAGISKSILNNNDFIKATKNYYDGEGENLAPEFALFTLEGKQVKLSDFKGKIILLDFWATWCAPCRKSIPDLVSIQKEFNNDVQVIGVSFDQAPTLDDLERFIVDYEINYPVVIGTIDVAIDYGNIRAIPTLFIIDRNGKIREQYIGLVSKSDLVREIKSIISEK